MAIPTGQIYLLENVFINNKYEHTVDFESAEEQFAFWHSFSKKEYPNCRYIRKKEAPFIVVEANLDEILSVNYLMFRNKEDGKMYYAFVTRKEYAADKTTYLYFEIDVLQTYMFDYKFMPSYVLREHQDRWTADHKPIYSRVAEDLEYGQEYTTEAAYKVVTNPERNTTEYYTHFFLALCVEHSDLIEEGASSDPTRIQGTPTPYCMYLLPLIRHPEMDGMTSANIVAGNGGIIPACGLGEFMDYMGRSAMGNFVKQIIHIPYLPFEGVVQSYTEDNFPIVYLGENVVCAPTKLKDNSMPLCKIVQTGMITDSILAEMGIFEGIDSAMPTKEQWAEIKSKPLTTERDKRFESKLLTFPYRYNILTDFRGQPAIVKNEYIGGDKIKLKFTAGLGFNTPYRFWVEDYRKDPEGRQNSVNQLTPLESPILSDAYYTYMLQNKNQLQANVTNAAISGASNTVQGFMTGGIVGGIASGISSGLNVQALIRSQNAKKEDIKNMPDTILNSNDCSMCLMDDNLYLTFYRKKICCEFEELIADTFNMTGYTCKRVKLPNLKSRARFNYIQTVGANIKGSFDQEDLGRIKSIFDAGVTFWHYSKTDFNPLDYTYENIERSLL